VLRRWQPVSVLGFAGQGGSVLSNVGQVERKAAGRGLHLYIPN
jgi:hypothetical protein